MDPSKENPLDRIEAGNLVKRKSSEVKIGDETYDLLRHPTDRRMGVKSLREELQNDLKVLLQFEKNQFRA